MTYYRLAYQKPQTAQWIWKTTVLTSLHTLFQWLRIYGSCPQNRIRVFSSSSKEGLEEMLMCENCGQPSDSITAEQFLRDRHIQVQEGAQSTLAQETTEQMPPLSNTLATSLPVQENSLVLFSADESYLSSLDRRRLEIEQGPGGDHDVPYRFSLPISTPQLLAWICLQSSVRAEALQRRTRPLTGNQLQTDAL
jgi:hypothetical protein